MGSHSQSGGDPCCAERATRVMSFWLTRDKEQPSKKPVSAVHLISEDEEDVVHFDQSDYRRTIKKTDCTNSAGNCSVGRKSGEEKLLATNQVSR